MAREQLGIILVAAIVGFMLSVIAMQSDEDARVVRLGYDLPSAIYPEHVGEASNKFRISLIPKEDLQRIAVRVYWLHSRSIPNSTLLEPAPTSEAIRTLLGMVEGMGGVGTLVECDASYNGSPATVYLYDFGVQLRTLGAEVAGSTVFAYVKNLGGPVLGYFEGVSDFFPFPENTIASLRLTCAESLEVYSRGSGDSGSEPLENGPRHGVWIVESPRSNKIAELAVLLSEDARLYVDSEWGTKPERMQITIIEVDGEVYETLIEFI